MLLSTQELTGRINEDAEYLVPVSPETTDEPGHLLRKEVLDAWMEMQSAAEKDGISLIIISSFRSFERQKRIWENKWTGKTITQGINLAETIFDPEERARLILKYSAMPGTSRHHWGTDFDINSLEDEYFIEGKGKEEYEWMRESAGDFGFAQPYTEKTALRPTGYEEEKWHWSYLPLSRPFLKNYLLQISYDAISGFEGAETAEKIGVIERYVKGINPVCL